MKVRSDHSNVVGVEHDYCLDELAVDGVLDGNDVLLHGEAAAWRPFAVLWHPGASA